MSEDFIEDINKAADVTAEAVKVADTAAAVKVIEDAKVAAAATAATAKDAGKTNNSSSTTDADAHKNDAAATDSGDTDVAPTVSPEVEELASKLGWNKDHKGAESVDAATYILRSKDIQKTMKDHNKDLKGQLTGLQGSVEALKDHNERVYKADVKKLQNELTGLKKEKRAAVELADVAKVEELDQQIEDIQKDIDAPVKEAVASANPDYDDWVADNEWYLTDPEMATYADTVAEQYAGAPLKRIYNLVRQKVAEVFPDKFEAKTNIAEEVTAAAAKAVAATEAAKKVIGPNSPVEAGSRTGDTANFTKADLSPDQVTIMSQFVKGGIMTEDQYIADIAKMQGA